MFQNNSYNEEREERKEGGTEKFTSSISWFEGDKNSWIYTTNSLPYFSSPHFFLSIFFFPDPKANKPSHKSDQVSALLLSPLISLIKPFRIKEALKQQPSSYPTRHFFATHAHHRIHPSNLNAYRWSREHEFD